MDESFQSCSPIAGMTAILCYYVSCPNFGINSLHHPYWSARCLAHALIMTSHGLDDFATGSVCDIGTQKSCVLPVLRRWDPKNEENLD